MGGHRFLSSDADDVMEFLRSGHDSMVADLDASLEMESGLREILLRSDHSTQISQLSGPLDVEGGLSAIVRPATPRAESDVWYLRESENDFEDPLDVEPMVRMVLRQEFAEAHELLASSEETTELLELVASLAEKLSMMLSNSSNAADFTEAMQTCLHIAGKVAGWPTTTPPEVSDAMSETYKKAVELAEASSTLTDACRTLENARRSPHRSARNSTGMTIRDRQRALATALDDARQILLVLLDRALSSWRYAMATERTRKHEIRRALISRLGNVNFPVLTAAEFRAFLHDFMYADLRKADLRGVDLAGVRWSMQTRWPYALDVEELKTRSVEEPAGSGIFVVRSGTARMRQFAIL
ncbi:hypothetical protein [Streptomyces sp. NBRC 110465]|uniref:hypothetical protein n=1 Tax=Streptomyces sp. NBRC 110465 TaxID=1897621 RepID=UPI001160FABF|nr:hypothetical protein [Streptomyces sp. NBRC 110465]